MPLARSRSTTISLLGRSPLLPFSYLRARGPHVSSTSSTTYQPDKQSPPQSTGRRTRSSQLIKQHTHPPCLFLQLQPPAACPSAPLLHVFPNSIRPHPPSNQRTHCTLCALRRCSAAFSIGSQCRWASARGSRRSTVPWWASGRRGKSSIGWD